MSSDVKIVDSELVNAEISSPLRSSSPPLIHSDEERLKVGHKVNAFATVARDISKKQIFDMFFGDKFLD